MTVTGPVEIALVAFFSVSGLSLAGLTLYLRTYPTGIRGVRSFTALLALTAAWSFGAAAKIVSPTPVERLLVALELPLGVLFVLVFFVFASQYTGRDWHRRPVFVAYVVVVLLGLGLGILTNPLHHLFWEDIELSTAVFPHLVHRGLGPLYFLYVLLSYGLYCLAVYALLGIHLRSRYSTESVLLVAFGSALPLFVNVVSLLDSAPIPGLDYTPIGLALFGIATTWSIQLDFFDIVPLARDTAVEQSSEGMVILDAERRIRDFNPTAAAFLPSLADHRNDPLDRVVENADEWFEDADGGRIEFAPQTDEDRYLSVQTSAITDGPHHLGWTVVLSDITDQERRQRHLRLVSRVLRHNMANRINTIMGHAEVLDEFVDERGRTHLDAIDESASSIMETSAKLRTIQRIVTSERSRARTDVSATVAAVVARYSDQFPAATVTASCPDEVFVRSTVGLQAALENLVANGIEHDPDPHPSVTVTVAVDGDEVTVTVADEGPGIPDTERRILEEGETPLQHSSGVGLWLVYCFVEQSGRDLTFELGPEGGSEVSFTLVRAPAELEG
ncbi:ATP-binding protein [Halomicroarcula sp. F13]|uniref:histidine kinase n=1 Tax=Haloarcula rubra TaxID=2487747 RepID=A0AAW4PQD7_9EURY|nr:histidine kinase N-terminal 7TM domain-containing protein [Halomicroarcula rubra]MBX0322537.1 ATP-binding protein [Halomicroarcula rubra]